jgi:hypothetical protein
MQALHLYAGPAARRHIEQHGLAPGHVGIIAAAAGGPKGMMLGALDRFIFGRWLAQSAQPVDLVGASIGAWRMACACMDAPAAAFEKLESGYIHGDITPPPGRKRPAASQVSAATASNLRAMYADHIAAILSHPRYRLHVITAHGRHLLARAGRWRTPAGYAGAVLTNAASRRALGAWLERVVFSTPAPGSAQPAPLPFATHDYRTLQRLLTPDNFYPVLQASGSIPFLMEAVHDIAGAPRGAYWDGGITDYHLHLAYRRGESRTGPEDQKTAPDVPAPPAGRLVLYPHFQRAVVPGWLDKSLKWRHRATPFLDHLLVLAPNPDWVRRLPGAKLPDRNDFKTLAYAERVRVWTKATQAARQLAEQFEAWLARPDPASLREL